MKRVIALCRLPRDRPGRDALSAPRARRGCRRQAPATIEQFLKIRTPGAPVIMPDGSLLLRGLAGRHLPAVQGDAQRAWAQCLLRTREHDAPEAHRFPRRPGRLHGVARLQARGAHARARRERELPAHRAGSGDRGEDADPRQPQGPGGRQRVARTTARDSCTPRTTRPERLLHLSLGLRDWQAHQAARQAGCVGRLGRDARWQARAGDGVCLGVRLPSATRWTLRPASSPRSPSSRPRSTASCDIVGYMPDEKSVLMTSDCKDGMSRLYLRNLKSGKVTEPIPALSEVRAGRRGRHRHA